MRSRFIVLAAALFAIPALACPPIQGEQVDEAVVAAFQRLAIGVDTPCAAYFSLDGKGGALVEYLPEGESLDSWTNMMTANVVFTGAPSAKAVIPVAARLADTFKNAGGSARILSKADGGEKGPLVTLVYDVGQGDRKEYAAVVVRTMADDKVGILQRQRHGVPLTEEEIARFFGMNGIR